MLRQFLIDDKPAAALNISRQYQKLMYFPHALEILLHDVLDDEVDRAPPKQEAILPSVLSFLAGFPDYLDIVVQCTRKTEVRSWRTLFAHLPPPQDLFEESLRKGLLKTAGGYLLVLHTFQELSSVSPQLLELLSRARADEDWGMCKELARFLMALDESGETLRKALHLVDERVSSMQDNTNDLEPRSDLSGSNSPHSNDLGLGISTSKRIGRRNGTSNGFGDTETESQAAPEDYFTIRTGS